MLIKLEARNRSGNILSLPLEDSSAGLILTDVDGLNPVKATIVSSSFAQQDGEQYHSSRREKRQITIKIEYDLFSATPVWQLRDRLYSYFMTKTEVKLRFFRVDGLTVDIVGRVEDFDSPLFVKEPEANIVILCVDPDLISLTPVTLTGNTTSTTAETLVPYSGTVESGLLFTLNVDRTLSEFTIYHRDPAGTLYSLDFQSPLLAGDVVTISTVSGNKYVTLTRAGISSFLLRAVSPQSKWVEFEKGDNYIRVYAIGAAIPFNIAYTPKYGAL